MTDVEVSAYAQVLGCEKESWPLKYLGLPLGGSPKSLELWTPVIEKMAMRLGTWRKNYISLGGRTALIKSTLSNLPTNYLFIFKALIKVIKIIEKMQRDFL